MLYRLIVWLTGSADCFVPEKDADRTAGLLVSSGADVRFMRRRLPDETGKREKAAKRKRERAAGRPAGKTYAEQLHALFDEPSEPEDAGNEPAETAGGLAFSLRSADLGPILRILRRHGIEAEVERRRGLPKLLERLRGRFGLAVGFGMFAAILWLSGRFIWSFEVVGNTVMSDREILALLEEKGCRVGTYIPSIDFDALHTAVLLDCHDLAWIAVNVKGTHAAVEVREMIRPEDGKDEGIPCNLIADEDGVIESISIYRGEPAARAGELVREGELLASGVIETKDGFRLIHARGSVLAAVERELHIEIPPEKPVKVFTGNEVREKSLKFFGFSINLFRNTGNLPPEYDKIKREDCLRLFDRIELPIRICETVYREYRTEIFTRGADESRADAFEALYRACAAAREEGSLIGRTIEAGWDGDTYVIECRLELLREIAAESEIYRSASSGTEPASRRIK